jgi:hypothetical protein
MDDVQGGKVSMLAGGVTKRDRSAIKPTYPLAVQEGENGNI